MSAADKIAADRRNLPGRTLTALTVATAMSVGTAAYLVPTETGEPAVSFLGGAFAGAIAVLALRSLPVRTTVRWMCTIGALLALRFGDVTSRTEGPVIVLLWVVVTTQALVIAARAERWTQRTAGVEGAVSTRRLARLLVVTACLTTAAATALGPSVATALTDGVRQGDSPSFRDGASGTPLAATDRLDMTRRPRLTDALVMTVATEEPGFWRTQTFDEWDGSTWALSDRRLFEVPDNGEIDAPEDHLDDRSAGRTEVTDDFRLEAPAASALPMSPTAVAVSAPGPLVQSADGSVASQSALGKGASYRVVSERLLDLAAQDLTASEREPTPEAVLDRYAQRPVATDRVRDLAATLAEGADTRYEKVQAVEAWLDANMEYSLDAPLAPTGVDVVDHFLFESKQGWCEQIASSLTVLLRLQGVPARLAVGFVPGNPDPVTGRYRVLEKQAHAWTEVWFPGLGWVPFDPTAGVPLGGGGTAETAVQRVVSWAPIVLVTVALVVGGGGFVVDAVRRLVRRRRAVGPHPGAAGVDAVVADGWPAQVEAVLERVGERWDRARAPSETASAYAADLAVRAGDDRLAAAGTVVDRARFGADPPGPAERAELDALLDEVVRPPATP